MKKPIENQSEAKRKLHVGQIVCFVNGELPTLIVGTITEVRYDVPWCPDGVIRVKYGENEETEQDFYIPWITLYEVFDENEF